ncbi:hypothetical protein CIPAW_02G182900 [Carya illinoinensis]|uniref:Uncharacterized protein n=1 Tax=Carya illinoinensis TaxID=32201 RepID=A0A8T1RFL0_CARIL|nr:hypothetical protein CIPAW_02G182900 [Carya illinoinensis]
MKRKEVRICLLLAFIFITSGCYYFTAMRIRSAESAVDFMFKPAKARESPATGFKTATWECRVIVRFLQHLIQLVIGTHHPGIIDPKRCLS